MSHSDSRTEIAKRIEELEDRDKNFVAGFIAGRLRDMGNKKKAAISEKATGEKIEGMKEFNENKKRVV